MIKFLCIVVFAFGISSASSEDNFEKEAEKYLEKYGYLDEMAKREIGENGEPNAVPEEEFKEAIVEFQKFVGLNATGKLDRATVKKMKSPRCGDRDMEHYYDSDFIRRKRYLHLKTKWTKTDLTYKIHNFPSILDDKKAVTDEIAAALKPWSSVTPLTFKEVSTGHADINIIFARGVHSDGPKNAFDGKSGVLAHAYAPESGEVHFDDEEPWTIEGSNGQNLYQTAVHELGHALGLHHSTVLKAVMYPYATSYNPSFGLHLDDIEGMQAHYGGPAVPDLCHGSSIDTVTTTENGKTYFFKDAYYWELLGDKGFARGYPRRISDGWNGLPDNLDASVTWSNGFTYFFKGTQYWKFKNQDPTPGFPRLIRKGFPNIPDSPDAVFVWKGDGLTYFLKGNKYWRLAVSGAEGKDARPISEIEGLPYFVDAAFKWKDEATYVFQGDSYYELSNQKLAIKEVDNNSKLSSSIAKNWFACK